MAALMNRRAKAFWVGPETFQTVWAEVVRPPTAWLEVEQLPLKGATRAGEAPVGVVESRPVSLPPEPAQRPYPAVPGVRVVELEGMVSDGAAMEARAPFWLRTVITAPPGALVEMRVQIWGTELTSEEATAEVVRVPRSRVPPLPEKVPSQAVAEAWLPTLKVMTGSTEAEMLKVSSSTITTMASPLSLVQVKIGRASCRERV